MGLPLIKSPLLGLFEVRPNLSICQYGQGGHLDKFDSTLQNHISGIGAPDRTLFELFSKTWNKKIENVEIPAYPIPVSLAMEDACPPTIIPLTLT